MIPGIVCILGALGRTMVILLNNEQWSDHQYQNMGKVDNSESVTLGATRRVFTFVLSPWIGQWTTAL